VADITDVQSLQRLRTLLHETRHELAIDDRQPPLRASKPQSDCAHCLIPARQVDSFGTAKPFPGRIALKDFPE